MGFFSIDRRVARGLYFFRLAQQGHRWYWSAGKVAIFWILLAVFITTPALVLFVSRRAYPDVRYFLVLWLLFWMMLPALALVRRFRAGKCADMVIHYLHQGLHVNHPLPEWLAIAAGGERGPLAARLLVLSEVLRHGTPLSTALRYGLWEMAPADLALITQAEAGGSLPQALERLERRRQVWRNGDGLERVYLLFLAGGLFVVAFSLAGTEFFVFPKMIMLARSFGAPIPTIALAIEASRYLLSQIDACFQFVLLGLAVAWLRQLLWPWYARLRSVQWLRQRLLYYTPLIGHIYRPGQWADVTRCLAQGVADGRSLAEILQTAESGDIGGVTARRLSRWRRALARGAKLRPAAERARLPSLLCAVLDQPDATALAESLNYVSGIYRQRYRRRMEIFRSALIPASVVGLGLVVGLLTVGLWQMYLGIVILFEHAGPY